MSRKYLRQRRCFYDTFYIDLVIYEISKIEDIRLRKLLPYDLTSGFICIKKIVDLEIFYTYICISFNRVSLLIYKFCYYWFI